MTLPLGVLSLIRSGSRIPRFGGRGGGDGANPLTETLYVAIFSEKTHEIVECSACTLLPIGQCTEHWHWWIISLHIRSMWETICDAKASWTGWKLGSEIPVYPILGFGPQFTPNPSPPLKMKIWPGLGNLSFDFGRIPPPPSENENLARTWHFEFWLWENTPPPPRRIRMWRLISVSPKDTISLYRLVIETGVWPFKNIFNDCNLKHDNQQASARNWQSEKYKCLEDATSNCSAPSRDSSGNNRKQSCRRVESSLAKNTNIDCSF